MFQKRKKEKDLLKEPRLHHYYFAHVYFRTFCERYPRQAFEILSSDKKDDLIKDTWDEICKQFDKEQKTELTAEDIRVSTLRLGRYPVILVQMPEAKAIVEAIMVAIVLTPNVDSELPEDTKCRYFVLELGSDLEGGLRTVLCEWKSDGHFNMGDGPEPQPESFLNAIEAIIT